MDEVEAFFDVTKPHKPIVLRGGTTGGRVVVPPDPKPSREIRFNEAEKRAMEADVEDMRRKMELQTLAVPRKSEDEGAVSSDSDPVYTRYNFTDRAHPNTFLPIDSIKDDILSKLKTHKAIVVDGATGCGKSTRIPQMLLDEAYRNKSRVNIVVTQPRRIATRSIAERVCAERGWQLGTVVGYQVGLDKDNVSEDTRIVYCTTGVLYEKLIKVKTMDQYTHIILDEVHERDQHIDFLFIIIRLLASNSPNVKIILMSATFETTKFSDFFRTSINGQMVPAPIIKVQEKNEYQVRDFYLDDLQPLLNRTTLEFQWVTPQLSEMLINLVPKLLSYFKHLEQKADGDSKDKELPAVLIFLPGIFEIGTLHTVLKNSSPNDADENWKLYVLHSMISSEEQRWIFKPVPAKVRKIILTTNIAESSLTVPNVKYVIDFCMTKYLVTNSANNFTSLELDWASRNNCRQRSGRAGRVMHGRCYRMIPKRMFNCCLQESAVPEILRSPLETVVLKAKILEMGPPHSILSMAMDPPKLEDIANTVLVLKELGAMLATVNGTPSQIDGDITFIGRIMSSLPIDVRASRLIVLGYCFSVLEDAVIMAAGLTNKSVFRNPFDKRMQPYSRKLAWSNGSGSDLFAMRNAYKIWELKYNQKEFGDLPHQKQKEKEFGEKNFLEIKSLIECHHLVQELKQRLNHLDIKEMESGLDRVQYTEQEKSIILKAVISGAFYPNFFVSSPNNDPIYDRDIYHTLNGRDPHTTVYFSGFNSTSIRELYVKPIKELFRGCVVNDNNMDCIKLSWDKSSEKVFVTFNTGRNYLDHQHDWDHTDVCSIPGKIVPEVYKAIKMRRLGMPTSIQILRPLDELAYAEKHRVGTVINGRFEPKTIEHDFKSICMPGPLDDFIDGCVTHVETVSKIWFQPKSEAKQVAKFFRELNEHTDLVIEPCTDVTDLKTSTTVAARDKDEKYYRARIVGTHFNEENGSHECVVQFIDFGHTQQCPYDKIYVFKANIDQDMPPRCYQCCLAELQPSMANTRGGSLWSFDAQSLVNKLADEHRDSTKIKVYSIVNGVVHAHVIFGETNLNKILIENGYGEFSEENYPSKLNHYQRCQDIQNGRSHELDEYDGCLPLYEPEEVPAPPYDDCYTHLKLNGPHTPCETNMYSTMRATASARSINIDPHSVNSVLLNADQHDSGSRYMVAAAICQKGTANRSMIAHETTLLPNIQGFGPLMAMVFAPQIDLKRDETRSRYISVKTGLGYSKEKQCSLFEEHDNTFFLDFELTKEDIATINQLRYCIDMLLYTRAGQQQNVNISKENKAHIMRKIKNMTINLLMKNRRKAEYRVINHNWMECDDDDLIKSKDVFPEPIFPLHSYPNLYRMGRNAELKIKDHCADLHRLDQMGSLTRETHCKLCSVHLANITMLRIHLMSSLHSDREKQIGYSR